MSKQSGRNKSVQTVVPSTEYIAPQTRASQSPDYLGSDTIRCPHTLMTLIVTLFSIFFFAHCRDAIIACFEYWNCVIIVALLRHNNFMGFFCSALLFVVFATLHFPDGILIRPSPVFWRFIKAMSLMYLFLCIYLHFEDYQTIRRFLHSMDPRIGIPFQERNYDENCNSWSTFVDTLDFFVFCHLSGWVSKAIVIRDLQMLWILSILFEVCEKSLAHILENFNECWWDTFILDLFGCNLFGIIIGMQVNNYLNLKEYCWKEKRRSSASPVERIAEKEQSAQECGESFATKLPSFFKFFTPYVWTPYAWPSILSSSRVFLLSIVFLLYATLLDLNVFFIKAQLCIYTSHWSLASRTVLMGFVAVAGVREYYEFLINPSPFFRIGVQCWIGFAIITAEASLCFQWRDALRPWKPCPQFYMDLWIGVVVSIVAIYLYLLIKETLASKRKRC